MNINDTVVVKLTKDGRDIFLYDCINTSGHDAPLNAPPDRDPFSYQTNISNEFQFQLWELMRIFGKHIQMAGPQLFVDNEIKVNDTHEG